MYAIAEKLSALRSSLEELESAVQQPRDERHGVTLILEDFPAVMQNFYTVLNTLQQSQGNAFESVQESLIFSSQKGWLCGDLHLWLRLATDYEQIQQGLQYEAESQAIAQDIRACSSILWETYEILLARFRYQTQIQPMARLTSIPLGQLA